MFRTAVMMAASLALTGAVVAHAYYLKHQFYPTVVYLTKSSPSMAVSSGLSEGGLPRVGRQCLWVRDRAICHSRGDIAIGCLTWNNLWQDLGACQNDEPQAEESRK